MSKISLMAYKISELNFKNAVNGKMQLKFSNKVSHNVRYSSNSTCEATLKVDVFDKEHPDSITLSLTIQGVFRILENIEKEFIHVETCKALYPMARAIVSTVSGTAGIPPIVLKDFDIESQEIYRMEMGGHRRNTSTEESEE